MSALASRSNSTRFALSICASCQHTANPADADATHRRRPGLGRLDERADLALDDGARLGRLALGLVLGHRDGPDGLAEAEAPDHRRRDPRGLLDVRGGARSHAASV